MHDDDGSVLVLFGTETGNSQDYARLVARKCQRLRIRDVQVKQMNDCSLADVQAFRVVIAICSTTGQGELPRNAQKLWKQMLRRKLPPTTLSGTQFSSFGLGDSSYPRYNWAIRKIHNRLKQLGAREFCDRGEGDEQSSEGMDEVFDAWLKLTATGLRALFPLEDGEEEYSDETLLEPLYRLEIHNEKVKRGLDAIQGRTMTRPHVNAARVTANDRLTAPDHFQDVRSLKFECSDPSLSYAPGDTVALFPTNDPAEIDLFFQHQGLLDVCDYPITVNEEFAAAVPGGLVSPLTLRSLFLYHLDLTSIPRRSFFASTWHFAADREQERLQEFASIEGLQDLFDYANRPRRSILETVLEFDTLKIPPEYLLDVIPILHPRLFSIASPADSSSETEPLKVELAVAIVKYKTILRRIRRGVCTRWIQSLQVGDKLPFTLHSSPLPTTGSDTPMILIAPGTGVAPVRSLILTRLRSNEQSQLQAHEPTDVQSDAKMNLFFGCRYDDKDYIFQRDWEAAKTQGALKVVTAFSRQGGGYVQDRLFEHREHVGKAIVDHNALVYLCGSSGRMPREVRITLVAIVKEALQGSEEEALEYIKQMETGGRYLQETWS